MDQNDAYGFTTTPLRLTCHGSSGSDVTVPASVSLTATSNFMGSLGAVFQSSRCTSIQGYTIFNTSIRYYVKYLI